ncbi:hypothetical protein BDN72DRAFT_261710 [Pluteus cervinus]|uniref:Uncharacterized protein n=1 Tax=Pluteus cervinus TaxID=181527 RepID=A0ACD3AGY5_9AGAR|nr:hypothetical protein BDN72DRAFT_261710 [Pluteus cervinus]
MKLYLSKADHLQSLYSPRPDGTAPLYQTESHGRTTILKKFLNDGGQSTGNTASTANSADETTEVGRLRFSMFSTLVKLGERKYETALFKRSRVFVGPDGNEYRWVAGPLSMLFRNDQSYTLIAQFHLPINHETGYLEISPSGIDIIDFIVLTFIYIERRRRKELTKSVVAAASRSRSSYLGRGGSGTAAAFHQPSRYPGDAVGGVRNQRRAHRGSGGGGVVGDTYGGDIDNHINGYDYSDHHQGWGHGHDHNNGGFDWGDGGGDFGGGGFSGGDNGSGGGVGDSGGGGD